MNIHEHQAKEILKEFGAPVSNGVVIKSVNEISEKIKKLKSNRFVLKAPCGSSIVNSSQIAFRTFLEKCSIRCSLGGPFWRPFGSWIAHYTPSRRV